MLHALVPIYFGAIASGVNYEKEGIEFAKEQVKKVEKLDLEKALANKEKLKKPKVAQDLPGEGVKGSNCDGCHMDLENPMKNFEMEKEDDEKILVFVSFSMPKIALKELNSLSVKYDAKLILRGLHEKSFKKTAEKILEIDEKGLRLEIDPELFKKYEIKKVPTFVLIRGNKEISRLSGNVTLEYAKSRLVE